MKKRTQTKRTSLLWPMVWVLFCALVGVAGREPATGIVLALPAVAIILYRLVRRTSPLDLAEPVVGVMDNSLKVCQFEACAKLIPNEAAFCSFCGRPQSLEAITGHTCRACGKGLLSDVPFCHFCGKPRSSVGGAIQESHHEAWNPQAIRLRPTVGGFISAVGESAYLDELNEILRGTPMHKDRYETIATLSPEPSNEHDPNAIKVLIGNKPVGYLSRADAKTFRKSHSAAIASGEIIQCRARLTGGTDEKPNIGVLLDFNIYEEVRYKRPLKDDAT